MLEGLSVDSLFTETWWLYTIVFNNFVNLKCSVKSSEAGVGISFSKETLKNRLSLTSMYIFFIKLESSMGVVNLCNRCNGFRRKKFLYEYISKRLLFSNYFYIFFYPYRVLKILKSNKKKYMVAIVACSKFGHPALTSDRVYSCCRHATKKSQFESWNNFKTNSSLKKNYYSFAKNQISTWEVNVRTLDRVSELSALLIVNRE